MRNSSVNRDTKETSISASVNLDGTGQYNINTGIGFLDHMLEQLSKHSLIDINIQAEGDLHIDFHHTTEDVGIVLGQAIKKALGEKKGITRFSNAYVAMDEALSRVVIDVSGRPYLVWNVNFSRDKIGEMDTELFKEFFAALAGNAGITLHVESIYGENNHHIIESCFKATAKALLSAITVNQRMADIIPSTKGNI